MEDTNERTAPLAKKIMSDLAVRTSGNAQRLLMNMDEPSNGFEAWQRLVRMGEGGGGIRRAELLRQILKYDFQGDFQDRLDAWQKLLKTYTQRLEVSLTMRSQWP